MKPEIFDGCLSEEVLMACTEEAESTRSYTVMHRAGGYGFKNNWMVYDSKNESDKLAGNFLLLWEEIKPHIKQKVRMHRCYVNAHTYGVEDAIHQDDGDIDSGLTVVVYLCRWWHPEWFGQTVFWGNLEQREENDVDIVQSVIPKSNRFVVFDKNIFHCVTPLSRRFTGVRLTCMFKLELTDAGNNA